MEHELPSGFTLTGMDAQYVKKLEDDNDMLRKYVNYMLKLQQQDYEQSIEKLNAIASGDKDELRRRGLI